ncbi:MAG: hypothetical protein COV99_05060 [Bacteroidetes bacterium CG12_big_fil_rev_8_21_14_0_65_60_17]|nr:MAG: hypothetical protein COV99_05060 [Bacteroidetes bacterium CG12_big_fil_rev_8_21_14_0_65_60_17]
MNSEPSIVCIDHAALSDLMFWEQVSRAMHQAGVLRPAPIMLLGSGEEAEAATGGMLSSQERRMGELPVPVDATAAFERVTREQNKAAVFRLTDASVSTVGLIGADRGLLSMENGNLVAGAFEPVESLAVSGVVCVVSCVAAGHGWTDVHPVRVAAAIRKTMGWESPYTVMSQRITSSFPESGMTLSRRGLVELAAEGGLPEEVACLVDEPVFVEHASRWKPARKS